MAKILKTEIVSGEKPVVLLYGNNSLLIRSFVNNYKPISKIFLLTQDEKGFTADDSLYLIPSSGHSLSTLEDKFDYSLFFISQEEDLKKFEEISEKIVKDNTKISLIFPIDKFELYKSVLLKYKEIQNVKILFIGNIISDDKENKSELSKIIHNVLLKKTISLADDSLYPVYPISLPDAIKGVSKVLFGNIKHKSFYLFYSHPQTLISCVHLLKRIEPDLEIKFENIGKTIVKILPREEIEEIISESLDEAPYFLDEEMVGFEKTVQNFTQDVVEETIKIKEADVSIEDKKVFPKPILPKKDNVIKTLRIFFLMVFATLSLNLFSFAIGLMLYTVGVNNFAKGDYISSLKTLSASNVFISFSDKPINFSIDIISDSLGNPQILSDYHSVKKTTEFSWILTRDFDEMKNGKTNINKLVGDLQYLYFESQKIKRENTNSVIDLISSKDVSDLIDYSQIYGELFGFTKEKNYLVFIQNNGVITPNGGQIVGAASLKIINGQIKESKFFDTNDLDKNIKTSWEPNYIVKKYLDKNLLIRNSNYSLNLSENASSAANIYFDETGNRVDGIIYLDYESILECLKNVDTVYLKDYKKTLNENNFMEFMKTIDGFYKPGSTERKIVIENILSRIIKNVSDNPNRIFALLRTTNDLLESKHVSLVLEDSTLNSVFAKQGYMSIYKDSRVKKENGIYDALSVNITNIQKSPTDFSLEKDITYESTIDKGEISSKALINIQNKDNKNKDSTVYLQIVVPLGSLLTGISLDGENQEILEAVKDPKIYEARSYKPKEGIEVNEYQLDDFQVFGFPLKVKQESTQKVEVRYKNGSKIIYDSFFNYSFFYMKQPGESDQKIKMIFNYPNSYEPTDIDKTHMVGGTIQYSGIINADKEFLVPFVKK